MIYQEFVSGRLAQQRYWARAHLGWRRLTLRLRTLGIERWSRWSGAAYSLG
jgi:hypothetical protein